MPSVTYGALQNAIMEGLALAAPEVAQRALPHLIKLLRRLDVAWPAILIAGRAFELLEARDKLVTPDAIVGAFSRAAKEVANTQLAREWMKLKPFWRK